jgi:hypothetical protein
MDYVFEVSGTPKSGQQYLPLLEDKVEELGGTISWDAQDLSGCGRRIQSSRCVVEVRFPNEAILSAISLIQYIVTALPKRTLRIDSIFYEPSTLLFRSRSLGPPECVISSSPPKHGKQRPARGVNGDDALGPLVQAISEYLE